MRGGRHLLILPDSGHAGASALAPRLTSYATDRDSQCSCCVARISRISAMGQQNVLCTTDLRGPLHGLYPLFLALLNFGGMYPTSLLGI